jgi:hypothetical protein
VLITFDLELFLGQETGTVKKCIYEPTISILKILKKFKIPATFFVDAGYILALKQNKKGNIELEKDFELVIETLSKIRKAGSHIELHLHPQWLKGVYKDGKWVLNSKWYKLQNFSSEEILQIVYESKKLLEEYGQEKIVAFRAGGWCIEPFSSLKTALERAEVFIDSSVFKGGYIKTRTHNVDFRNAPDMECYYFSETPLLPDPMGKFLEVQITSFLYSPIFYLSFYTMKKFLKKKLQQFGDGKPISSGSVGKLKYLVKKHCFPVSLDLYRAAILRKAFREAFSQNKKFFVIMGHPKRMSEYSLKKFEEFLRKNISNENCRFIDYKLIYKKMILNRDHKNVKY